MVKIIGIILVSFFVGIAFNRFLLAPVETPEVEKQCTQLTQAKDQLLSISQKDYTEYTQIKDLKQKYEKADELLGKVMLLFLADVGFRVQHAQPEDALPPTTANASPLTGQPVGLTGDSPVARAEPVIYELAGKSAVIRNLGNSARINEELTKAEIKNVAVEAAKASYPLQKQFKMLEGTFTGTVHFFDPKRESFTVSWDLRPNYGEKPITANFSLKVTGPAKNCENSGNGQVKNISTLADDTDGILVEICGNENYMQLYYNNASNALYGNYYESTNGTKKYNRVGTIEMKK